ncbi:Putative ammonia monooxygenase [Cedecea lapagei]|uniref:Ammonia monooxygenase n=1 Tax=Cedecea lapagei TaxID=158823 RepID=A0A447V2U1_9ENTR|nr:AbrB family transcriptional regulator [Cedecea lapagei]VEB97989.1 Putative ammonia monooxygenase [Cedecea lapagei]
MKREDPATPNAYRLLSPQRIQWGMLIAASILCGGVLNWLAIPAALLLGPMIAGIVISLNGARIQPHGTLFLIAQGIIGCMIASKMPFSLASTFSSHWLLFIVCVFSVIFICMLLGWIMTRMRILPGTTALWGLSPGAATAMTLMAEANGADAQLVAAMQYLRVIMVAGIASALMTVSGEHVPATSAAVDLFDHGSYVALAETAGLIAFGCIAAKVLRLPAGALLITLVAGVVLSQNRWMDIALPQWVLVLAYTIVGWRIGLKFTRPLLRHAAHVLPRIAVSIAILIALCGVMAAILVMVTDIDPLTAYLAMSPGGADSVAIIAASSKHIDIAFVMSMQMTRFIILVAFGPVIAALMKRQAMR